MLGVRFLFEAFFPLCVKLSVIFKFPWSRLSLESYLSIEVDSYLPRLLSLLKIKWTAFPRLSLSFFLLLALTFFFFLTGLLSCKPLDSGDLFYSVSMTYGEALTSLSLCFIYSSEFSCERFSDRFSRLLILFSILSSFWLDAYIYLIRMVLVFAGF